jgi:putative transcriptional regulator
VTPTSTKGRLLVATPPLEDPNFDRTVVYMIEHGDDGAIGVIINRPLTDRLEEPLDRWEDHLGEPALLHDGGPVDHTALIGLARGSRSPDEPVDHAMPIGDGIWSIDLAADPVIVMAGFASLRVFRGYAGWSPGQLEGEIRAGAWVVVHGSADDVFSEDPARLWRRTLARQPGRLAWLAEAPDDLDMN